MWLDCSATLTCPYALEPATGILSLPILVCADSPSVSISPTASPVLVTPKVEEHVELDDSEPGEYNYCTVLH